MRKLFSLYLIGAFFNTVLPGLIGGDAVKAFYLYRATGKGSLSLASIFMDRYIGFVMLIIICTIVFPFGYSYFHNSPVFWIFPFHSSGFYRYQLFDLWSPFWQEDTDALGIL